MTGDEDDNQENEKTDDEGRENDKAEDAEDEEEDKEQRRLKKNIKKVVKAMKRYFNMIIGREHSKINEKSLKTASCSLFAKKQINKDEAQITGLMKKLNITGYNSTKLEVIMVGKCLHELPANFTSKVLAYTEMQD
jgi:hypothetical protein